MSIWKDPKVELPEDNSIISMTDGGHLLTGQYNNIYPQGIDLHYAYIGESPLIEYLTDEDGEYIISKWCYEEDLIKQAQGE